MEGVISQAGKPLVAIVEELLELLEGGASPVDPAQLDALQRAFDAACRTAGAGLERPNGTRAAKAGDAQLAQWTQRRDELERAIASKDEELQRRLDALHIFRVHVDVIAEATMPAACDELLAAKVAR